MDISTLELQVKELVALGDIEAAIHLLTQFFQDNDQFEEIIIQSGMYHTLKQDQRQGVITYAEVQQKLNQLRVNILRFIKLEVRKNSSLPTMPSTSTQEESYENTLRLSLARMCTLSILQRATPKNGLTVSGIYQQSGVKHRKYVFQALEELEKTDFISKEKVEGTTYWKLSQTGEQLVEEFQTSMIFNKTEK